MTRMQNITTALNAAGTATETTFGKLPLSAQVKITNGLMYSLHNGIKWWNEVMEDEDKDAAFRKRAVAEVKIRRRSQATLQDFLSRAAHYSSGVDTETKFDTYYDGEDGASGDIEYAVTTLNGHPFAWAKASLEQRLVWDANLPTFEEPVDPMLFNVHKALNRYAARYTATLLLNQFGLLELPKEHDDGPSDMVVISAMSPKLRLAAASGNYFSMLDEFKTVTFKAPTYVDGKLVVTEYSREQLVELWRDAIRLDREDAEQAAEDAADVEAKAEAKAFAHEVNATVRDVIKTTLMLSAIAAATEKLSKAGVSNDVTASVMQQLTAKLMPQAS